MKGSLRSNMVHEKDKRYLGWLPALLAALWLQGCATTSPDARLSGLTPLPIKYNDEWTTDSANAFLDAYKRVQLAGDRLNDAIADEFSKVMIEPPFMVLPDMDKTFWKVLGKTEACNVVITTVTYPEQLVNTSRVKHGVCIQAVESKEVHDIYTYLQELQLAGRAKKTEVSMKFSDAQSNWTEVIPLRRQKHDMNYYVINTKKMTAYSVQGPHVFISQGMVDFTESQDELALILGHEIGHFRMGDYKRVDRIAWGQKIASAMAAGAASAMLNYGNTHYNYVNYQQSQQIGRLAGDSVLKNFSQPQEERADKLGLYYIARAGFDPDQAIKFWKRFADAAGSASAASHPDKLKRYQYLAEEAKVLRQMGPDHYLRQINLTSSKNEGGKDDANRTVADADRLLSKYKIPLEKARKIKASRLKSPEEALRVFMQLRYSGHAQLSKNIVWPEYFDRMMISENYSAREIEAKHQFLPYEAYNVIGKRMENDRKCLLVLEIDKLFASKNHNPDKVELYLLVKGEKYWQVLQHEQRSKAEFAKTDVENPTSTMLGYGVP